MIRDTLVYHPLVTHYLKFVATTAGRDKLFRTLQYFSRFYVWYLLRINATPSGIAPWESINKQFGLARKVMRLGKNVEHFKAAAVAADSKNLDPVIKYCTVGRQLGYAVQLSLDSIIFLDSAGIRRGLNTKRLQHEAHRFWMIALLFSTVSGAYSMYNLRQQRAKIDKKDGDGAIAAKRIERESAATNLQFISDLCDLVVPTSELGIASFNDGLVSLTGISSSLIGVYNQWKETA